MRGTADPQQDSRGSGGVTRLLHNARGPARYRRVQPAFPCDGDLQGKCVISSSMPSSRQSPKVVS